MMRVYVEGIGLCGPGLGGWTASVPVLAGRQKHGAAPTRLPPDTVLPANERRRAGRTVKLALAVGTEAFVAAGRDPVGTATVFASSGADGETIHEILSVLASANRELSPTRFHHSVHNTPAGYWGLATGSRAPSSSLCCHDDSFIAGMLEAVVLATVERRPVALICYDVEYPAPLCDVRRIGAAFAAAFVFSPTATAAASGRIEMSVQRTSGMDSAMPSDSLEALRRSTPAARSLPLLAALASDVEAAIAISYLGEMAVALDVSPIRPQARATAAAPEWVAG